MGHEAWGVSLRQWWMIAAAVGAVSVSAFGQCRYEVTLFTPPDCPFQGPLAGGSAVNLHGVVVGSYRQCDVSADEAFVWSVPTGLVTLERVEVIKYRAASPK